jgi:RNA polymerase sigma-70 factor (ECF subfamily)
MRVCARLGRSLEDSEDLVQDSYVRFLEYRQRNEVRNEEALLSRIVTNLAINQYRRQRTDFLPFEDWRELDPNVLDPPPDAFRMLVSQRALDGIIRVLNLHSRRTCEIFLAHRAGYSYDDIMAALGISGRTVQKHIRRATVILGVRPKPASRF